MGAAESVGVGAAAGDAGLILLGRPVRPRPCAIRPGAHPRAVTRFPTGDAVYVVVAALVPALIGAAIDPREVAIGADVLLSRQIGATCAVRDVAEAEHAVLADYPRAGGDSYLAARSRRNHWDSCASHHLIPCGVHALVGHAPLGPPVCWALPMFPA